MKGFSGFGNSPVKQKPSGEKKTQAQLKKEFEEMKYKAEHQKAPKPGESYLAAVRFDPKTGKMVEVPPAWKVNLKKKQAAEAIDKIGQRGPVKPSKKKSGPLKQKPGGVVGEAVDHWSKYKSKFPKGYEGIAKTKMATYKPIAKTKLAKWTPKSITPKSLAKGALRVAGEALMVADIVKGGMKNIKEGKQTLYKGAKGHGGKTWAERKKESKSNVWKKNK